MKHIRILAILLVSATLAACQTSPIGGDLEPEFETEAAVSSNLNLKLDNYLKAVSNDQNWGSGYSYQFAANLNPSGNQLLVLDGDLMMLLDVEGESLGHTTLIDTTDYIYPYSESDSSLPENERKRYEGMLSNAGWLDDENVFIATYLQLIIHNIKDGSNKVITPDFKPVYENPDHYLNWVGESYQVGNQVAYVANRIPSDKLNTSQIYLVDANEEILLLENQQIALSTDKGFLYIDGGYQNGMLYTTHLSWYDVNEKQSYMIYEVEKQEANPGEQTSGLFIGQFNKDWQTSNENPDLIFEDDVLQFYVTDVATGEVKTHEYDTVSKTLIK